MTSTQAIHISPSEISQIVVSVFSTMLGLDVTESDATWFASGERLTAAVQLSGHWNGAVLLECDRGEACRFAGRFLSDAPPSTVNDIVRDVLGELANMIGGNMKCVLQSGIHISTPSVVDGGDYCLRICKAEVRERVAFQCAEGPFWVTLLAVRGA